MVGPLTVYYDRDSDVLVVGASVSYSGQEAGWQPPQRRELILCAMNRHNIVHQLATPGTGGIVAPVCVLPVGRDPRRRARHRGSPMKVIAAIESAGRQVLASPGPGGQSLSSGTLLPSDPDDSARPALPLVVAGKSMSGSPYVGSGLPGSRAAPAWPLPAAPVSNFLSRKWVVRLSDMQAHGTKGKTTFAAHPPGRRIVVRYEESPPWQTNHPNDDQGIVSSHQRV